MCSKNNEQMLNELYELIASMQSAEDCRDLFADLCTIKEIEQMAQRVKAAKLLIEGKTYNQVIDETDISSATLSRVSRCVQYGNGYSKFLK
ncbi:MAG: TrpR-related protein YerC/YecD [Clostridia bacterium]|nr:TrpR-related protein YerC/YecD [Clostridia bacterium]